MATLYIAQSADEQENQVFIASTEPTEAPSGAFRYDYKGYFGCDCHCTLEIDGNLVICTEDDDNEGTSITNMAEHLAHPCMLQFRDRSVSTHMDRTLSGARRQTRSAP